MKHPRHLRLLFSLVGVLCSLTGLIPMLFALSRPGTAAPTGFGGGPYSPSPTELTPAQRATIEVALAESRQALTAVAQLPPAIPQQVSLAWPLQPAPYLADYGYYGVSGFMDHDPAFPDQLRDYDCGNRTYDTTSGYNHQGTDYFLWPYPFNKMDNAEVYVVAAAPGVIVYKQDGYYDRSCSPNGGQWNAVFVAQADGSTAWYGHLKNGSVTAKPVGSTVAVGEYLGVVGSSGNSTGPHLHFELHDAANQVVDPYSGACQAGASWWAEQRPYYDSAINKLTTGHAAVNWQTCPLPDEPNISDSFQPGQEIFFTTYYRDQLGSQESQYTVYRPDGSIFTTWSHSMSANHYPASWWWWSFDLPGDAPWGTWRFVVLFAGQSYETYFNVGQETAVHLLTPTLGTQWVPGDTETITWADNLGGPVRLELWQGSNRQAIIASSTPSNGAYIWPIPATLPYATNYQVRVIDLADDTVYGQSQSFALVDPATLRPMHWLTPLPGEIWPTGQPVTISWTTAFTGAVALAWVGPTTAVTPLITTTAHIFTWTVPLTTPTGFAYHLRLTDLTYPTNQVAQPVGVWNEATTPLWLLSPNGGERWETGQVVTLRWRAAITSPLRLELRQGEVMTTLISTTLPAVGQIAWTVPLSMPLGADYRVWVVDTAVPSRFDSSDAPFLIWNPSKTYLPILQRP